MRTPQTPTRDDPQLGSSNREPQRKGSAKSPVVYQPQFEFVEGLKSKTERRKTRSWVTKQHYRKKRLESSKTGQDVPAESKGKGKERSQSGSRASKTDDGQQFGSEKIIRLDPGTHTFSHVEQLGGGRADPFNSYPIPATRDVHELVDHYCYVIPSLVHTHWARAVRRPRSCWDLFNLYRTHEIPFLGMLHHAAHHQAGLRRIDSSLQTIEFKQRSLVAVNHSLRNLRGACDDWTLIGIGLLANAERIWGDREIARMHWGALKRLLLERGGFPALKSNPPMHTKLVWSFIALSWPTADGNPAYVDGFIESAAASREASAHTAESAFKQSCDEFIHFFNTRKSQTLKNLPSTPEQQRKFRSHQHRGTAFRDGGELISALKHVQTGYESPDKRRAVDNCRMACLIHLNLVLAEYGDFSIATEQYLMALQRVLADDDDDSSLSAEHLLWTLLMTAFKRQGHYERIWKMSRLVGVVKRTNSQTWLMVENALQTFLQLPESIDDLGSAVKGWKQEDFLQELLGTAGEIDPSITSLEQTAVVHAGADTLCSEGCQICPLKPASF